MRSINWLVCGGKGGEWGTENDGMGGRLKEVTEGGGGIMWGMGCHLYNIDGEMLKREQILQYIHFLEFTYFGVLFTQSEFQKIVEIQAIIRLKRSGMDHQAIIVGRVKP